LFDQLSSTLFEKYEGTGKDPSTKEINQCLTTWEPYIADDEMLKTEI
jgi:hypothetical protein